MSIKRFEMEMYTVPNKEGDYCGMEEHSEGDYILYSEVAAFIGVLGNVLRDIDRAKPQGIGEGSLDYVKKFHQSFLALTPPKPQESGGESPQRSLGEVKASANLPLVGPPQGQRAEQLETKQHSCPNCGPDDDPALKVDRPVKILRPVAIADPNKEGE